jgi:hypothetical protein
VLAAGAVLVGLVNAAVYLIHDGFAVEDGLGSRWRLLSASSR